MPELAPLREPGYNSNLRHAQLSLFYSFDCILRNKDLAIQYSQVKEGLKGTNVALSKPLC